MIQKKEELKQFIGAEAELPDMLNARERRVWVQEKLLAEYSGVLVSFTLNIPGSCEGSSLCAGDF